MPCEFCNYNFNIEPQRLIYEDENYIAFISRDPVIKGHCVITSKDHADFITDIAEPAKFFVLIKHLSQAIKDAVFANHVKIETRFGNDNHDIKHSHLHLVPVFMDAQKENAAEKITDIEERILQNLRKSQWYGTLNG